MNTSIIPQLIKKDFLINRKMILVFCLMSLMSIGVLTLVFGRIPNWVFANVAFTLLVAPAATCGIVLLMRTIVLEKEKYTQSFIMSLPVTVKEFTMAKLLVNLPLFGALWLIISGIAFYFAFGLGVFPYGCVPFITMIFLGIFVAYIGTLGISLIFQSLSITILAMSLFELGTPAYLWIIAFWEPINNHLYNQDMVWNSTAIGIVTTQILIAVVTILMTWFIQKRKRDFI